ncbi:MAG: hypothetical protein JSU68_13920 [Phycisphaerales bacterium]|nr:MAG: hypothetical protein JSU68_13920 [Phycisphaerales bacterium]
MYCRRCHYNLYGLPENRCPECGTPFDPDDDTTYWPQRPTFWHRFRMRPMRPQSLMVAFASAAFVQICGHMAMAPLDWDPRSRESAPAVMAENLREALRCWIWQTDDPCLAGDLDVEQVRSCVPPRISPRSDWLSYYARESAALWMIRRASWDIGFLAAYCGFFYLAGPHRARRWLGPLCIALLLAGVLAAHAYLVAGVLPGPHRGYVSDFVYIQGFDWSDQDGKSEQIIAFEKQPWGFTKPRRVVAFAHRGIHVVPEWIFRRLAAEQGIALPEPRRRAPAMTPTAESQ